MGGIHHLPHQMKSTTQSAKFGSPDHVPGPMEVAAFKAYFERGSAQKIESNSWRTATILSLLVSVVCAGAVAGIAMQQQIQVFQVAPGEGGQLQVVGTPVKFTPSEDMQMAWASRWLADLTQINPALWEKSVSSVQSKVTRTAPDQVKSYLSRPENNPAALLSKQPGYVREYERRTVNKVGDMTYLVRYDLVSRPAPGTTVERKSFAATVTLASVGHSTRDDVFNNPEGLAVSNLSISEEAAAR
jgi:type IV secretion system protein VirB5